MSPRPQAANAAPRKPRAKAQTAEQTADKPQEAAKPRRPRIPRKPAGQQTAAPTIARFPGVPVEVWPIEEFTYLQPARWNGTLSLSLPQP